MLRTPDRAPQPHGHQFCSTRNTMSSAKLDSNAVDRELARAAGMRISTPTS